MLPRRSNEEIEDCSEMAKLSPKVDIENRKTAEQGGYDHEDKNEELDSEEVKEKEDVFDLVNAYSVNIVQKPPQVLLRKVRCNFKSKKSFNTWKKPRNKYMRKV